jgi:hypothetical protein
MNSKILFEVNMPVVSKIHGFGIITNRSEIDIDNYSIKCFEMCLALG